MDEYSGLPVAGADVTAGGTLTETTTAGVFSFDNVPLSTSITAKAPGYAPGQSDSGTGSSVDIKLRPTTLTGKVTDAKTGKPLAGVLVKLSVLAPPVTATATISAGETLTPTVQPAATGTTTSTMAFGKGLAAPPLQSDASTPGPEVTANAGDTGTVTATVPTNTPLPPTATPTPRPVPPTGPDFVAVYTDDSGAYSFDNVPQNGQLTLKMPGYKLTKVPVSGTAKKDVALEEFKVNGIYITAPVAATAKLYDGLLKFISNSRINTVVLNVQNDNSEWVFDTKNPDVLAAKDTDLFMPNMADVVKDLKSRGIYTIARIVTFQEPTLAKARLDWAVKSSVTGKAWLGGQLSQQAWLDASNPAVQDYVVSMTKEVLGLGFDEIQYDYVRFPSDPAPKEPGDAVYSKPLTDTTKALAIEQFLTKAYDVIQPSDAFMSIDIFGYTLWPDRDGVPLNGTIGQVFENMVGHTDYISPMIYPSHFSPGEEGCAKPEACAFKLVQKSGEFAAPRFAGQKAKYRPWLEDFDWGTTDYTSPGTTKVTEQIQAAESTGAWGWMFWDPWNDYEPRAAFSK